ncbi:MAG: CDP-diacylglycerol--serine O-phosphatidyltransferase [Desulfotomaculaceae bacterium]|nr:CDP-diacylglycerol--serine O-phosphatidyltransferase [Desulfotomaculaceae bacterium]
MSRMEIMPNLCTAANLLLGVAAITSVINYNFQLSVVLIVLAAILDRADGILARRYNAVSTFGKEFDSLSDLVSFGVAPAALLYCSTLADHLSIPGLLCFMLFTLCGTLRLARFNVTPSTNFFLGIPITVAGAILAVLVLLVPNTTVLLVLSIILSLLMVSNIRIPKF